MYFVSKDANGNMISWGPNEKPCIYCGLSPKRGPCPYDRSCPAWQYVTGNNPSAGRQED